MISLSCHQEKPVSPDRERRREREVEREREGERGREVEREREGGGDEERGIGPSKGERGGKL